MSPPSEQTATTHDSIGRMAAAYLAGRQATGLPEGAAFEAFRRLHNLSGQDVASLRAVLTMVESAARSEAA